MTDNTELLQRITKCKCPSIKTVIEHIIRDNLTVSTDDYGIAQIWCKYCDEGITWDEGKRHD